MNGAPNNAQVRETLVLSVMHKVSVVLSRAELAAVTGLFIILVIVNFYALLSRYILNDYPGWIIETSEALLVHIVFLGGAWLYRSRKQIAVTLIIDSLSSAPIAQRSLQALADIIVVVFASIVLVQAYRFQPILFNSTTPVLGLPKNIVTLLVPYAYLSILLSASLFILAPRETKCP